MKYFFLITACLVSLTFFSQCPECIPDETCVGPGNFPAVCPETLPNGSTGIYYEQQMTFYMPAVVTDPGSGFDVTLEEVTLTSVNGLPYGLVFTLNEEDQTYEPASGQNFGCATLCGIPLIPGSYDIAINVDVLVSILGFETTEPQTFTSTLIIDQGEGSASSFTYDNIASCGDLNVNYNAIFEAPAPAITTYFWDFGNGETSTAASPSTITYTGIGDYDVILTTTVTQQNLETVSITSLSDNWSGDIDDAVSTADPYFVLTDGSGVNFTSAVQDNTTSTSWTDLAIALTNPPYVIQFFDEDDISPDDDLGNFVVSISTGENAFIIGNGTNGSLTILPDTISQFSDTATVSVFPAPDANIIVDGDELYFADPGLTTFNWFLNNIPIEEITGPTVTLSEGGSYYAIVGNEYGCTAESKPFLYCPPVEIAFDAPAGELQVSNGFESYQWFYNGEEIIGADNYYIEPSASGEYFVEITTWYGCTITSESYDFTVGVAENEHSGFDLFPNPSRGQVTIVGGTGLYQFVDPFGRIVFESAISANKSLIMDVSILPPGVYIITNGQNRKTFIRE